MNKLLPCPFCGSTNLDVCGVLVRYVHCLDCGTDGPWPCHQRKEQTQEEAVEAWNRRVPMKDEYEVYG